MPPQQRDWIEYQQLVLTSLEKQEDACNALRDNIGEQKVSIAEIKRDLSYMSDQLKDLTTKHNATQTKQAEHYIDLQQLKWKIGAWSSAVSAAVVLTVQSIIKYFLQS